MACWNAEHNEHTEPNLIGNYQILPEVDIFYRNQNRDAHINATLASLREAVRNGLLKNAVKRKMK